MLYKISLEDYSYDIIIIYDKNKHRLWKRSYLNWKNYDNSPSIKLTKYYFLAKILKN